MRRLRPPAGGLVLAAALLASLAAGCSKRHAAATAEPEFGTLELSSEPAGATVRIDGETLQATTPEVFALAAGSHRIELLMPGHTFTPPSTTLAVPARERVSLLFVEYAPVLAPDASAHTFDPQQLFTSSAAWCFSVRNAGNAAADSGAFTLEGPDASDYLILSGAEYRAFAPGATQDVCVAYRPQHTGASHASIRVGRQLVALSGSSFKVPCRLTPSETAHDFGSHVGGQSYPSWCFTITNDDAVFCSDTLHVAGANPDDFEIVSGGVYGLPPGASQTVCVAYRPTLPGPVSGAIAVGTDLVRLAGTGIGSCALSDPATPDSVAFGALCVGHSATRRIVLTNTGNLRCTVAASACGAFSLSPASAIVPAGGTSTFTVGFEPAGVGDDSCAVTLTDGEHVWPVTFSGRGVDAPVADFDTIGGNGIPLRSQSSVRFKPVVVTNGSPITSYLWDFGDGFQSTEVNATHGYRNGGFYVVQLTVTNACGSATAIHTYCVEEPAYFYVWNFDLGTSPGYTTNVPAWTDSVPLVLYRNPHAFYTGFVTTVCLNVRTGEVLRTGLDEKGVPRGGAEAIGGPGQTLETAQLPVSPDATSVTVTITEGAPDSPYAPLLYLRTGLGCEAHLPLGRVCCNERGCEEKIRTTHCYQVGGDNHIEWGLEPQATGGWMHLSSVRVTYNGWYVCPAGAPQTRPLRVVNSASP